MGAEESARGESGRQRFNAAAARSPSTPLEVCRRCLSQTIVQARFTVGSIVAPSKKVLDSNPSKDLGLFCVEVACSPRVCMGSLASSHCQKHDGKIYDVLTKLTIGVNVKVNDCLSVWPNDGLVTSPG